MFSGDVLKQRRKEKGLKQSELAKLCDISPITISRYENNVFIPKLEHLEKIAAALGCSPYAFDVTFENFKTDDKEKKFVNELLKFNPATVHEEAQKLEIDTINELEGEFIFNLTNNGLPPETLQNFFYKNDDYFTLLVLSLNNLCLLNDKGLQKVLEYTNDLLHNPDYTKTE